MARKSRGVKKKMQVAEFSLFNIKFDSTTIVAICGILSNIAIVWLSHYFWNRQKKREFELAKNKEKLETLTSGYSLLAYLSNYNNIHSVMKYDILKNREKEYYIDVKKYHEFSEQLSDLFYKKGLKIKLGEYPDIKINLFFDFLQKAMGIVKSDSGEGQDRIVISNKNIIERNKEIYTQLNQNFAKYLQDIYK